MNTRSSSQSNAVENTTSNITELVEEEINPRDSPFNRDITPEPRPSQTGSSMAMSEREFMAQMLNTFRQQMSDNRTIAARRA
jgi:hypothetical protein